MAALFDPRWASALGWALLHFLWQGALLGLLTALLFRGLRRSELRYLVGCGALALCVLLPTGTAIRGFQSADRPTESLLIQVPAERDAAPALEAASPRPSFKARVESTIRPQLPRIVGLWALGCALLALRLGSGWIWMLRWRHRTEDAPGAWIVRLQTLSQRMGLRSVAQLRISRLVDTPLALGLWKPAILVPASLFTGMAPELLEALLAHELAHIQRHDYLVNLLQSFVEVMLFYHPAVWWISRKVRTEREFLADNVAAKVLGEPRRLALALNALDDLQPHLPTPALAASGGHLMNRIHRLLRPMQDPRKACVPYAWLLPALLSAALLTPLAAAVIQETKKETPTIYVPSALVQKIDALARQEGIDPALLRAIAQVESHFNPRAVSQRGATGLLQVLPETALKFGATNLEDPDQVARAGARYLRHLLDTYQGDLNRVVPAYNGGEAAVNSGQLSDETRRYAPAVLALLASHAVQPDDLEPVSLPSGSPLAQGSVTAPFGQQLSKGSHPGIDYKGALGSPVTATADGTTSFAGPDGERGITVILQHGGGVETLYSHLASTPLQVGQRLLKGETLGTVGRTGNATGPHVHYEVHQDGKPINPTGTYMVFGSHKGKPDTVLLLPPGYRWEEGGVSGELRSGAQGDLEMNLKIQCRRGELHVEVLAEGETQALGEIRIGDRPDAIQQAQDLKAYTPRITFKNTSPGKRLRIRCKETAPGEQRWGETTLNPVNLPSSFAFPLDHQARKQ